MKKFLSIILTSLCLMRLTVTANATSVNKDIVSSIEYLSNGDYIETVIEEISLNSVGASRTTYTKKSSKTNYYKDSNGNVKWYVKVTGTFAYDESTSTCISCSKNAKSNNAYWTIKSSSVSKSGNSATAKATATHTTANGLTDYTRSVTIKCSANGTVS